MQIVFGTGKGGFNNSQKTGSRKTQHYLSQKIPIIRFLKFGITEAINTEKSKNITGGKRNI